MGILIIAAVAIIVGAILFQASAQQVGSTQQLQKVSNATVTFAAGGVTLNGRAVNPSSSMIVTNATGGETVPSTNYTVANNVILSNGNLGAKITPTSDSAYKAQSVNVSYSYEPTTYDENTASQAVANLIVTFAGLAIAVVAIWAAFGANIREMIGY